MIRADLRWSDDHTKAELVENNKDGRYLVFDTSEERPYSIERPYGNDKIEFIQSLSISDLWALDNQLRYLKNIEEGQMSEEQKRLNELHTDIQVVLKKRVDIFLSYHPLKK